MEVIGSIYTGVTADFQRGVYPIARCVKAEQHDLGVVMADVNVLGSLEAKFESTNRIYDVGGCSPTLSTMQGGNQEPKILEAKQLGFMDNGTGKHQSNTVYNKNGLSPSITTITGGGTQQIKICEQIPCKLNKMPDGHLDSLDNAKLCDVDTPTASTVTSRYYKGIGAHKDNMCIVAMRGRNPDNPSDRTAGSPTEQRLEPNAQGMCNSLTTVQKDNMVLIKQATKSGSIECEVGGCFDASYPESQTRRGRVQDNGNTCPTLTAQNQEIVRIEKVGQISNDGSQRGTVISDNGISSNLVAGTHGYANSHIATKYRIRKLTPRECGRLMGVSDENISKMAAVNSNTQLYKQFGNSIVVDVMCAMFKNLNIEQESEIRN